MLGSWKVRLLVAGVAALVAVFLLLVRLSIGCRFPEGRHSCETQARTLRAAAQNWQSTNATTRCPTLQQLLDEKHLDSGGSYVDTWGHPFEMTCTDAEVYVRSRGPDGIANSKDDVVIPKVIAAD
ncbi:MAG: hypothetical protein QM784_10065 [Polyangiaceae bacterium]